ncbi:MAG: rhodanese-related sulfurtransferase [Chlamydiales bacterium]|nr:rhodanese-related sulfurtransferase [Chlamydiales bacterium]
MDYTVLAYYYFTPIDNPLHEVGNHKRFLKDRDARARIYISEEGINGQMSAAPADACAYMDFMKADPRFKDIEFKIHHYHEHAFPKLTIKYRKELVALGKKVDVSQGGKHVSPHEWREMLEHKDENTILIDVRNDYEWKVGRFKDSVLPNLTCFRDFVQYTKDLKKEYYPKSVKIMMCCTGGIRCEVYSAVMKEEGFDEVYQLQGGIIKYGLEEGSKHWEGKLFVFDDRMVVPISSDDNEVISSCVFCAATSDTYYNCANMDCNELFIACQACIEKMKGCCCEGCIEHGRVRAFEGSAKPYRKLSKQQKQCL